MQDGVHEAYLHDRARVRPGPGARAVSELSGPVVDLREAGAPGVRRGGAARPAPTSIRLFRSSHRGPDPKGFQDAAGLAGQLLRSGTALEAVRAALAFAARRFDRPVAAWAATADRRLCLAGARGLGPARARALRADMATVPRPSPRAGRDGLGAARRFGEIAGAGDVAVIEAGDGLLLVADPSAPSRALIPGVASLLRSALAAIATRERAERRSAELDLGLAWTAHEVRSPVLGARAVVERLLEDGPGGIEGAEAARAQLRLVRDELGRLSGFVDSLLQWSVGRGSLDRQRTDLVQLTREAADSCSLEWGTNRVSVTPSRPVMGQVDREHLRGAIANVLRNALAYAPSDSTVEVGVGARDGMATVSVRDRGPGIPARERRAIFEPFVRGQAASRSRGGAGLGLFIAQRVVEAHGGHIRVESSPRGSVFHVSVPVSDRALSDRAGPPAGPVTR